MKIFIEPYDIDCASEEDGWLLDIDSNGRLYSSRHESDAVDFTPTRTEHIRRFLIHNCWKLGKSFKLVEE